MRIQIDRQPNPLALLEPTSVGPIQCGDAKGEPPSCHAGRTHERGGKENRCYAIFGTATLGLLCSCTSGSCSRLRLLRHKANQPSCLLSFPLTAETLLTLSVSDSLHLSLSTHHITLLILRLSSMRWVCPRMPCLPAFSSRIARARAVARAYASHNVARRAAGAQRRGGEEGDVGRG